MPLAPEQHPVVPKTLWDSKLLHRDILRANHFYYAVNPCLTPSIPQAWESSEANGQQ